MTAHDPQPVDLRREPMPAVCQMAGLGHEDCERCPWPECVLALPTSPRAGGSTLIGKLSNALPGWRLMAASMPEQIRLPWIREKVCVWMWKQALPACREIVRRRKDDPETVVAAAIFVRNMETR